MRISPSSWVLRVLVICGVFCASCVAQNVAPQPLITQRIDDSQLVTLKGNTHPLALSLTDLGAASSDLVMHRMLLLLNRSSAQDAALRKLLDEQQEKDSSNYHQWLTPNQFGQQFGASLQDV
jgi:subtilase family serine protease